jgi:lipopolysaccharide biosynthesis glycosyltransferase
MKSCKYVYVLASSANDTYYEQFLLSVASLRYYNPDSDIIALVDGKTSDTLKDRRSYYKKYVSETKIISVPPEYSQKEASRWIKTSVNNYISGDFIFIDCDTIVTGNLVPDFSSDIQVGAVLDTHVPLSVHHLRNEFIQQKKLSGFNNQFIFANYFNSGIIFCKDTPETRKFFNLWHELWKESNKNGVSADQPSFNQADCEFHDIISELSGEWNCQISHNGLPHLFNAKIIHYYATSLVSFEPAYIFASPRILSSIKETGELPAEILKLLENPKSAFADKSRITADTDALDIIDSAYFAKLLWLRRSHKKLFFFLNKLVSRIKRIR